MSIGRLTSWRVRQRLMSVKYETQTFTTFVYYSHTYIERDDVWLFNVASQPVYTDQYPDASVTSGDCISNHTSPKFLD